MDWGRGRHLTEVLDIGPGDWKAFDDAAGFFSGFVITRSKEHTWEARVEPYSSCVFKNIKDLTVTIIGVSVGPCTWSVNITPGLSSSTIAITIAGEQELRLHPSLSQNPFTYTINNASCTCSLWAWIHIPLWSSNGDNHDIHEAGEHNHGEVEHSPCSPLNWCSHDRSNYLQTK